MAGKKYVQAVTGHVLIVREGRMYRWQDVTDILEGVYVKRECEYDVWDGISPSAGTANNATRALVLVAE